MATCDGSLVMRWLEGFFTFLKHLLLGKKKNIYIYMIYIYIYMFWGQQRLQEFLEEFSGSFPVDTSMQSQVGEDRLAEIC